MNEVQLKELLGAMGAIITGSHFVYNAGDHGEAYVNKDVLYTDPNAV